MKMPKRIKLNGSVVGDSDAFIYDWFGIPSISPGAVARALEDAGDEEIEILINSGGGSVFAGSEIYTMLKEHPSNITVKITALAASAASVFAMAGSKVMISPTAQIMIHNSSVAAWGDKGVMEQGREMLSSTDEAIANAYALKTGMSRAELLAMMDKETWLNAQEAQKLGFVDEIMFNEAEAVVASSSSFGGVLPQEVINKIRNELVKNNGSLAQFAAKAAVDTNKNQGNDGDKPMNFDELKDKHPSLVNQIMTQAINAERSRISALNEMSGVPGAAPFIKDAIENGKSAGDVAMMIVMASAERVRQESNDRLHDAQLSRASEVTTQLPANKAENEKAEEDAAVANMVQYANEIINKKGGRG